MSKIQGTLAQWRDRLRRKELSPAELVNLTADAIEADRTTNAYISFDREAALHAAAGADISSPLAGIPIAVKDNINVLGQLKPFFPLGGALSDCLGDVFYPQIPVRPFCGNQRQNPPCCTEAFCPQGI